MDQGGELLKFPGFGWSNWSRSNRGGTRQCHAEIISTRDLQRAVDFVSGVVPWTQNRFAETIRPENLRTVWMLHFFNVFAYIIYIYMDILCLHSTPTYTKPSQVMLRYLSRSISFVHLPKLHAAMPTLADLQSPRCLLRFRHWALLTVCFWVAIRKA